METVIKKYTLKTTDTTDVINFLKIVEVVRGRINDLKENSDKITLNSYINSQGNQEFYVSCDIKYNKLLLSILDINDVICSVVLTDKITVIEY